MDATATSIVIDPEFRDLIPPLTPDERQGLEADIQREGCLDRLKVWRTEEGDILLDGHNRREICHANDFPYEVESIPEIETREDAKRWIIRHQRHRRNLNETQRAMLGSLLSNLEHGQKVADAPIGASQTQLGAAEAFNVSRRSVQRARKVRENGIPGLVKMATAGSVAISAAADVAGLPAEKQQEIVAGGSEAVQEASRKMHQKEVPIKQITQDSSMQSDPKPLQMSETGVYPCAQCGSAATAKNTFDIFQGHLYYVICDNPKCSVQTPIRKSQEEVIAIWNRRHHS